MSNSYDMGPLTPEQGKRHIALAIFEHVPSNGSGTLIEPDVAKEAIDEACEMLEDFGYSTEEADLISGSAVSSVIRAKREIASATPEDFRVE